MMVVILLVVSVLNLLLSVAIYGATVRNREDIRFQREELELMYRYKFYEEHKKWMAELDVMRDSVKEKPKH